MEEEFSSNESGWTKYLGSPSLLEENYSSGIEDGDYNYYQGRDHKSRNGGVKHKENKDDDSITSDASSGLRKARGVNAGECSSKYKVDDDEDEEYNCGRRLVKGDKPCKQVKASTIVSKAKGALKQKRGKKTN